MHVFKRQKRSVQRYVVNAQDLQRWPVLDRLVIQKEKRKKDEDLASCLQSARRHSATARPKRALLLRKGPLTGHITGSLDGRFDDGQWQQLPVARTHYDIKRRMRPHHCYELQVGTQLFPCNHRVIVDVSRCLSTFGTLIHQGMLVLASLTKFTHRRRPLVEV